MSALSGPSPARASAGAARSRAALPGPDHAQGTPTGRGAPRNGSSSTRAGNTARTGTWERCKPEWRGRPGPEPGETGSAAAELVILAPLLVLLITVMVAFGELQLAKERLAAAAQSAVQAAALAPSTASGTAAAEAAASSDLAGRTATCTDLATDVRYQLGGPGTGGSVAVAVRCRASLAGIFLPGLPGSLVLSASATGPLDPFRNPVTP